MGARKNSPGGTKAKAAGTKTPAPPKVPSVEEQGPGEETPTEEAPQPADTPPVDAAPPEPAAEHPPPEEPPQTAPDSPPPLSETLAEATLEQLTLALDDPRLPGNWRPVIEAELERRAEVARQPVPAETAPAEPEAVEHFIVVVGGVYARDGQPYKIQPGTILTRLSHDIDGLEAQGIALRPYDPPTSDEVAYGQVVRRPPRRRVVTGEAAIDLVEILGPDGVIMDVRPGRR